MRRLLLLVVGVLALLCSLPAQAHAYPVVVGHCESADTVSDTSHTIGLDCSGQFGTIAAGNLLIVCWHGSAVDGVPHSAITGFTVLRDVIQGASSGHIVCLFKVASGSEGTSVLGSTDLAERTSAIALRITGHHGSSAPEASTGRNDASGGEAALAPNPDSLTPTWGAEDTTFIALGCNDGSTGTDITAWPASYGSNNFEAPVSGEGRLGLGTRELNATSDDPSPFTVTGGSGRWAALTLAVRPGAAGGATGWSQGSQQLLLRSTP